MKLNHRLLGRDLLGNAGCGSNADVLFDSSHRSSDEIRRGLGGFISAEQPEDLLNRLSPLRLHLRGHIYATGCRLRGGRTSIQNQIDRATVIVAEFANHDRFRTVDDPIAARPLQTSLIRISFDSYLAFHAPAAPIAVSTTEPSSAAALGCTMPRFFCGFSAELGRRARFFDTPTPETIPLLLLATTAICFGSSRANGPRNTRLPHAASISPFPAEFPGCH